MLLMTMAMCDVFGLSLKESHRVSEQYYESTVGRVPMTGEAAGRQMWYYDKNSKFPNDQLTFCAAENPNASDKVGR